MPSIAWVGPGAGAWRGLLLPGRGTYTQAYPALAGGRSLTGDSLERFFPFILKSPGQKVAAQGRKDGLSKTGSQRPRGRDSSRPRRGSSPLLPGRGMDSHHRGARYQTGRSSQWQHKGWNPCNHSMSLTTNRGRAAYLGLAPQFEWPGPRAACGSFLLPAQRSFGLGQPLLRASPPLCCTCPLLEEAVGGAEGNPLHEVRPFGTWVQRRRSPGCGDPTPILSLCLVETVFPPPGGVFRRA